MEYSSVVDHSGLLFKCPDIFDDELCLPYDDLQEQIESTLLAQWDSEPLVAAVLLFLTFNQKDLDKLNAGKEIICKYFANIIANPTEEKYQRIRLQNAVFREVNSLKIDFFFHYLSLTNIESRTIEIRIEIAPSQWIYHIR